jgi:hypothetical protein
VLDINSRRLIVHRNLSQGKFEQIESVPETAVVSIRDAQIPVSELLP